MKITILLFMSTCLSFNSFMASSQKLHYTAQESAAIHDSISTSRWDIGGPFSQYSFRYMSEFFPVAMIQPAGKPYVFANKPAKPLDRVMVRSKKDSSSLEAYLKKLHLASFIVVHKGAIVYEKYFSMLPGDKHTLQSVNKVVTAMLITNLVNEKKIDINKPIDHCIPELKNGDWQGISVKDILNMRSGIDNRSIDFETGPFTNPLHKNYQLESALGILPKDKSTPASVYEYLSSLTRDTVPSVQAAYSNLNTFVLGWLAEKVTGKKYADLVTEKIWQPMGASSEAYVCLSPQGIAWPHGGMSATLRDLARFGMLFTHTEIKKQQEKLVSFAQIKEIFDAPPIPNSFAPFKWAYQWDLADDGMLMKGGFGGQALYVHPEKDIVIAYFNYVDKDWGMNLLSNNALNEILKVLESSK